MGEELYRPPWHPAPLTPHECVPARDRNARFPRSPRAPQNNYPSPSAPIRLDSAFRSRQIPEPRGASR
jgi:hypothetical protein